MRPVRLRIRVFAVTPALLLAASAAAVAEGESVEAAEPAASVIRVDFGRPSGTVRPLHGVNGSPLCRGETVDLTGHWRELGVPLARLHDVEWPRPDLVDLHAVFPDPAADPLDPASYAFAKTDDCLAAVAASGAGVVYRLGESIEHSRTKYHVHPPADPDRWAAACVGVVRHCNEGWAAGRRDGIRYWEVWNEPENRPACWTGTDEDYYRLYAAAATAIKARFPDLKVGGPSAGSVGEVVDGRLRPTPFVAGFLRHCREQGLPLDFFSWHRYGDDPAGFAAAARAVRRLLDEEGFGETEVHLNEWNYLPGGDWSPLLAAGQGEPRRRWDGRMRGAEGAAFAAGVLCELQDAPVDAANYFRGDAGAFGLFDEHGTPAETFHAFRAFRRLLDTPRRVAADVDPAGGVSVCAGLDAGGTAATVLVSNHRSEAVRFELSPRGLPWAGPTDWEISVLDDRRDLEPAAAGRAVSRPEVVPFDLPAPAVAVVRLTPAGEGAGSPSDASAGP